MSDLGGRGALGAGVLLVLATAVISGVSTFVNGYAVAGTGSTAFVTIRNLAVAAVVLPFGALALVGSGSSLRPRDLGTLAVIGLIGGAVPFVLFFRGLQLATAAHGTLTASFVYRTLFIFATVFGIVALRERAHPRLALAAALILGGNLLLLSLLSPIWTDGSAYVLAATLLWAAEYTVSKHALRRLRGSVVALGRMGFGAVFLSAYLLALGGWGTVVSYSPAEWMWVGISAALLAAFVLTWYPGLARVELGVASSVLVLGFPISWALDLTVSHAVVPPLAAVGAVVVVGGVLVALGSPHLVAVRDLLLGRTPRPWRG